MRVPHDIWLSRYRRMFLRRIYRVDSSLFPGYARSVGPLAHTPRDLDLAGARSYVESRFAIAV